MKKLNLEEFNNSKGITTIEDRSKGDLDPFLYLSLPEEITKKNSIYYKNQEVPFIFGYGNKKDNFTLDYQKIAVNSGYYTDIYLLGTSNNGNFMHDIYIEEKSGETIKEKIYFPDIYENNNDIKGIKTSFMYSSSEIVNYNATIWFCHISLKKETHIKSIRFLYNPFVHIFGITLGGSHE